MTIEITVKKPTAPEILFLDLRQGDVFTWAEGYQWYLKCLDGYTCLVDGKYIEDEMVEGIKFPKLRVAKKASLIIEE